MTKNIALSLSSSPMPSADDAPVPTSDACMGEHDLRGAKIEVFEADDPNTEDAAATAPRSSSKRVQSAATNSAVQASEVSSGGGGGQGSSSSSSSQSCVDQHPGRGGLTAGTSPLAGFDGSSALLAAAAQAASAAEQTTPGAPQMLLASAGSMADDDDDESAGASQAQAKRQKQAAEGAKKEKERRLNRVGLSYRCGRCGQPKKGHVCNGTVPDGDGDGDDIGGGDNGEKADKSDLSAEPKEPKEKKPPKRKKDKCESRAGRGGMDLDSDSIFKDIKSVLQTPSTDGRGGSGSDTSGAPSGSGPKRRKKDDKSSMPPPPVVASSADAETRAEKTALLEELDIAMQRPPSVITPEDGEHARGGPSSMNAAPSSLVSASDMFSPGQLMTHLLGTPTPAITPGLSPGTLNELGNMLAHTPGAMTPAAPPSETR